MSGFEDYDVQESDPDPSGDIGVSSEREGHAGPGQHAATGVRDNSLTTPDPDADLPPEQSTGNPEPHPDGVSVKAEPPSVSPRTKDS